jgi:hypothetical protein
MKLVRLACLATTALLVGCGGADDPSTETLDATAAKYADAVDFWTTDAEQTAWRAMIQKLSGDFDEVCGDTFCGGDYPNLASLGLTCSVSRTKGDIKDCVWTFGGSAEITDTQTGALTISKPTFQCHFKPAGQVAGLVATLGADGATPAIHRALPGLATSIYDTLGDCFQHPVGATPLSAPSSANAVYLPALDNPKTDVDAFLEAEQKIKSAFAQRCGDTFCEGDYPNLTVKRLACSSAVSSGVTKNCYLIVEGSYATVTASTGTIKTKVKSAACKLLGKGNADQLSFTINNTIDQNPLLDRPLPGSPRSLWYVLQKCL